MRQEFRVKPGCCAEPRRLRTRGPLLEGPIEGEPQRAPRAQTDDLLAVRAPKLNERCRSRQARARVYRCTPGNWEQVAAVDLSDGSIAELDLVCLAARGTNHAADGSVPRVCEDARSD